MYKHSTMLLALSVFLATGCKIDSWSCGHDGDDGRDDDESCCAHGHGGDSSGSGGGGSAGSAQPGGGQGGASAAGGSASTGGTPGTDGTGGVGNSGEVGASGGAGGQAAEPIPCDGESDCPKGHNCDATLHACTPSDVETCGELVTDDTCNERPDCLAVYAGTNCSCGADCKCMGGEPGCTCERFEFFRCTSPQ